MSEKFKNPKDKKGKKIQKKDQGDILGERSDKKFEKYRESKEAQLQADDFDAGINRASDRALKETLQEAGIPLMAKGGRAGFKAGSKGCKLAKRGRGRAYGKNS